MRTETDSIRLYKIQELINKIIDGYIKIPPFQRGFVWDCDNIVFLIDSIYRNYPIGTLLFWKTKLVLKTEKQLGPFKITNRPETDSSINYVLDGQQRLISIFGVFQNEVNEEEESTDNKFKVYFDSQSDIGTQEIHFIALKGNVNPKKYFPLKYLFDSTAYSNAVEGFDRNSKNKINEMHNIIKEFRIPVQILNTDDKTSVAIVFERINQKGNRLNIFQLLAAWTWNDKFDLENKFNELKKELEPFGFEDLAMELILQCCAAILGKKADTKTLINLSGAIIRDKFQEIANGMKGAIDFLRINLKIEKLTNLPNGKLLIPLSVFFAVHQNSFTPDCEQKKRLVKWFWKSCFSNRHRSTDCLNKDIEEIIKLKDQQIDQSEIDTFDVELEPEFFTKNFFNIEKAITKTFILLLAQNNPLSFVSGTSISLSKVLRDCNENQFHHIYPKAFLTSLKSLANLNYNPDCLANICFMSRADNIRLAGDAPSIYKKKMKSDPSFLYKILESSFCPHSIFNDDFDSFIKERAFLLYEQAKKLIF